MKRNLWSCVVLMLALVLALGALTGCGQKDTPPQLALNGVELDLSNIKVSDLNAAGFYLKKNDNAMPGKSFKELLSYYAEGDETKEVSMGGVSLLNRSSAERDYVKCEIFEITAKSQDTEGNLTGLQATYNGQEFFGKTKEELIAIFGEPAEESVSYLLVYRTEKNYYTTTFKFDLDTDLCYLVEIDRYEEGLVR